MNARLTGLSVSDFRSVRGRVELDLDAPVILIYGANGSGKTSLLSALELGLTGAVNSLQRSKIENNENNLIHVDTEKAVISVECRHPETESTRSEIIVQGDKTIGKPLLTDQQARFYTERCFLAQSILGRLLEIYEGDDARTNDNPLTRFVQELLGLDVLNNIIDGLHHLKDVRRLRRLVPLFGDVEHQSDEIRKRIDEFKAHVKKASAARKEAEEELISTLSVFGSEDQLDLNATLVAVRESSDNLANSELLSIMKHEISAAQSLWNKISVTADTTRVREAETALQSANQLFKRWAMAHEATVLAALDAASGMLQGIPNPRLVGFEKAHSTATTAIDSECARRIQRVQKDDEDKALLSKARETLEKLIARVRRLDERVSSLVVDSGALAAALSEVAAYVDGDICPICARNFTEVSEIPLRAHLTAHISSLSRTANELREITAERQSVTQNIDQEQQRVSDLENSVLEESVRNKLGAEISRLQEIKQRLLRIEEAVVEGSALMLRTQSAAERLSQQRQNQESLAGLRVSVTAFPAQLNIEAPIDSESIPDTLARCLSAIDEQQQEIRKRRSAQLRVLEASECLEKRQEEEKRRKVELIEAEATWVRIEAALTKANRTRALGKVLSDKAVTERTNIVRRVFNDSLNEIWKDLFVRLAPDERFIPAFAIPEAGNGPVVAMLETLYRGENRAGNPRSMLSAGNLNTAALTLFLSLHLSVEPVLPWLVIDDPVQSMDEIHIAQFAALLRALSRQAERQTIIAVHEKPLFDYLAFELSPAYEGDRLITIELSQANDRDTECNYDMKTWKPDSVLSVSTSG